MRNPHDVNSRKTFKALSAGTALLTLPLLLPADEPVRPPNIIYILADDLGYGDLSCYGQKKFSTPQIDRLAQDGLRFTQFYAGSAVCAPSRCSLMTGLHTGHAPVRANREAKSEGQEPMPEGTVTLPALLRQAGYVSGMFGKWGLGAPGSSSDPMVYFDEFFGYNCQRQAHSYYPDHLWHNRETVPLDKKTYSHDLILKASFDFIRAHRNEPFFCYLAVTIPHAAMQAPPALHEKYRKLFPQFENLIGKYDGAQVQNPVAALPAMIEHLDTGVGQLMDLLNELGIDRNTLIIFTSDNGPHKEGGNNPAFWNSSGSLRGGKADLYEGGLREPFIARWPGVIAPGTVSDVPAAAWDILPTLCELARTAPPADIDGISLVPALKGQPQPAHDYLYWELEQQGGQQALRKGNWKAVRRNILKNPQAAIELYDLSKDPAESTNVAALHPEIVQTLTTLLQQARTESKTFPLFPAPKP
ncbi:MAG TPA: arylsulfatase [Pontiellaceae bacterium]|nr:arylsulfatase [Pontiellaceae bacterium]